MLPLASIQVFWVAISELFIFGLEFSDEFFLRTGLIREAELSEHVRAAAHGAQDGLLFAPAVDKSVIAGEQHLRHAQPVPLVGAGILRILQKPVPVALVREADLVTENARNQTADRIGNAHRRQLAAGQDKVADGDLLIHAFVDEALVDALIVTADEDDVFIAVTELARLFLIENASAGGEKNGVYRRADLVADGAPAVEQRVTLHDGAAAAPVGIVVHLILTVCGVVADLVAVYLDQALFLRAAEDALLHHRIDRRRKERHDVKSPRSACPRSAGRGHSLRQDCVPE